MSRTMALFTLSAAIIVALVALGPAPRAQAVPPQQPATVTAQATSTATTTTTAVATTPTAGTSTPTVTATAGTTTPTAVPTIIPDDEAPTIITVTGYRLSFLGYRVNGDRSTTWRYRLEELAGAPNLTSWVLGLPGCQLVAAAPSPNSVVNPDPESGLNGVRWSLAPGFTSGEFAVTLSNATRVRFADVALSAGDLLRGELAGPGCGGGDDDDDDGGDDDDDDGGDDDDDNGGDDDDDDGGGTPAVIVIERPAPPTVVVENGVSFVVVAININNSGGRARGVFLVLDLELLELAELRFLQGAGYVQSIRGNQVIIGIGQNNVVNVEQISISLRLRVTGDVQVQQTVRATYRLRYNDDGSRETQPVVIEVVVPPAGAALTPTPSAGPSATPTATPTSTTVVVLPRLTVQEIDARFRVRWNSGGLRLYGLPLTRAVTLRSGIIVQYFERARFEYHPENEGTPYVILLGRLGVELGYSRPPVPAPTQQTELVWYFPATGHLIAPAFRSYWQNQGGLLVYGYPIGEAFVDDRGLTVQYFERARLELHPEFAGTENAVLLGLLGEELLIRSGGEVDDDDD